jgi:AraC-like DNA-binding protein
METAGKMGKIRGLVGDVSPKQLRYVDSFVSDEIGLFMPMGGACFYALTPAHTHPAYMFVLHFDDQTKTTLDGRTVTARPGKIFALAPGIPHQELPSDFPPRYLAIMVAPEFFAEQLVCYPRDRLPAFAGEFLDASAGLLPLLNKFMIEADNLTPGREAVLHGLGLEICHDLIRSFCGISAAEDRVTGRVEISRVIEFIHARLRTKMTVAKLAEVACMSPSHFSHVFKGETGKSPLDYVGEVRMRRVKKLLLAGDVSITEIALECGFDSPAYLTACFKKKYHLSPSAFRRNGQEGRISKVNRRTAKA